MALEHGNTGQDTVVFYTHAERRANKYAAKRELIKLRRAEVVAVQSETLAERRTDLPPRNIASLRELQRAAFRKVTGIDVEERHVMKQLLEQLERTGDFTVDDLRQEVRRLLRNADGASG